MLVKHALTRSAADNGKNVSYEREWLRMPISYAEQFPDDDLHKYN